MGDSYVTLFDFMYRIVVVVVTGATTNWNCHRVLEIAHSSRLPLATARY